VIFATFRATRRTCRATASGEEGTVAPQSGPGRPKADVKRGLMGRRGWRWRGAGEFYVFKLAAELLYLFLENLDLAFELGVKVLASYIGQKKNGSRANN
jgi:hypothetical protein